MRLRCVVNLLNSISFILGVTGVFSDYLLGFPMKLIMALRNNFSPSKAIVKSDV